MGLLYTTVANGNWNTAATWDRVAVPDLDKPDPDTVSVGHAIIIDVNLGDLTGKVTITGVGTLSIGEGVVVVTIPAGLVITTNYGTITSNYGTVTNNYAGATVTINNEGATVTTNYVGGLVTCYAGSVVTTNAGIVRQGEAVAFSAAFTNTGTLGDGTWDFNGGYVGGGTIGEGGVVTIESTGNWNLAGAAITWAVAATSTLTVDAAGTLNLGAASAANLTVSIDPTNGNVVTLGAAHMGCYALTPKSGTLTGNASYTITVGAGGFTPSGTNTISGTLNVDLSQPNGTGTGTYTQTAGTIATGGVLNVTTGTGAITYTALTKTGTAKINITIAANANIGWATTSAQIDVLTVNSSVTATASSDIRTKSSVINGTLALGTKFLVCDTPPADEFLTVGASGMITATSGVILIVLSADRILTSLVTNSNTNVQLYPTSTGKKLTSTTFNIGTGTLKVFGADVGIVGTLVVSNLTAGAITLGLNASSGILTLGNGTHTIGPIAESGTGTANAFTAPAGAVIKFSGDVNFTDIAADLASSAWFATATGKTITGGASITAAGCDIFANGFAALTLLNLGTINARGWNGCTLSGTTAMQNLPGPPDDY